MDVIDLVKKDHDRVEELFLRFRGGGGLTGLVRRATGSVPPRQRRSALAGVCRELEVHARVEEEILYPAIRETGDAELGRMLQDAYREHARVKEQLASLRERPEGEDLDARVGALEECVQHHVGEEENDMLPRVAELIDEAKRADLGRRMQAQKRALAGRAGRRTTRPVAARKRGSAARGRRPRTAAGRRKVHRKSRRTG